MMRSVVLVLCASLSLAACATFDPSNPADDLQAAEATFAVAEAGYDAICSVNAPPNFCTDPRAQQAYADSKAALEAAFKTADDALNAGTLDQATIQELVQDAINDLVTFEKIVNDVKAKKLAADRAALLSPAGPAGTREASRWHDGRNYCVIYTSYPPLYGDGCYH